MTLSLKQVEFIIPTSEESILRGHLLLYNAQGITEPEATIKKCEVLRVSDIGHPCLVFL